MNKEQYLDLIAEEYFLVCAGKNVLEIGPLDGTHTKIIGKISNRLTLIEPDSEQYDILKEIPGVTDIIVDDANFVLGQPLPNDVVVCCGVLYHLHSPLHLIELIVNNCEPQYVILDCIKHYLNSPGFMPYYIEELNKTGYRFSRPDWKTIGLNQSMPFETAEQAMTQLGYNLVRYTDLNVNVTDFASKYNFWMALWEKQ